MMMLMIVIVITIAITITMIIIEQNKTVSKCLSFNSNTENGKKAKTLPIILN